MSDSPTGCGLAWLTPLPLSPTILSSNAGLQIPKPFIVFLVYRSLAMGLTQPES
jgi:hypothetical protein